MYSCDITFIYRPTGWSQCTSVKVGAFFSRHHSEIIVFIYTVVAGLAVMDHQQRVCGRYIEVFRADECTLSRTATGGL